METRIILLFEPWSSAERPVLLDDPILCAEQEVPRLVKMIRASLPEAVVYTHSVASAGALAQALEGIVSPSRVILFGKEAATK